MAINMNIRLAIAPEFRPPKRDGGRYCVRIVGYHKPVTSNGFVKGPSRRITAFAYGSTADNILKAQLKAGELVRAVLNKSKDAYFCNGLSLPVA